MHIFSQAEVFAIFWIIGILIGILYDIFRAIRKSFQISNFMTNIQDLIFCSISGIGIIKTLIIINFGQIRIYIILAIILGMTIYYLTLSRCILLFCEKLLKLFSCPIKLLKKVMEKQGF